MKLKFPAAFTCFTALLLLVSPPLLCAQDNKDKDTNEPAEEEPAAPEEQLSKEELEEKFKKEQEAEKATVDKMMQVFKTLEGAWTGREGLRYEDDRFPAKTWKDEWEGKFTLGGRFFEMDGQTSGDDLNSAYKWVCTYDVALQRYRAWYFGETSHTEYAGKLSQDGKHVVWSIKNESNGSETRFTMKGEGNRVKCHGTDTLADGTLWSTQTSEYTRKRVEL